MTYRCVLTPRLADRVRFAKSALAWCYYAGVYRIAQLRYERAEPTRCFLPDDRFEEFVSRFAGIKAEPAQDYSFDGMAKRGAERCAVLSTLIQTKGADVLEIGAADGFVLQALLRQGGARRAVAVDLKDHLHADVKRSGVESIVTSAENMDAISGDSFDLVYSWGSFEHIPDIRAVFRECLRVLKPGGILYIEAGPLYFSPWGYHYYSVLKIPYIRLLFREELLHNWAARNKPGSAFPWTNGRRFYEYHALIQHLPAQYRLQRFWHGCDWFSAWMIAAYPEVFKSKRAAFEDFFIDTIRIIVTKRHS